MAPDLTPCAPPIHALPEKEFRAAIQVLGGLTEEICGDEDLMDLLVPSLRADFTLWESYQFKARPALPSSIVALGGYADKRAPADKLEAWRNHTRGDFHIALFAGDHFYLNGPNKELLSTVSDIVLGITRASQERIIA